MALERAEHLTAAHADRGLPLHRGQQLSRFRISLAHSAASSSAQNPSQEAHTHCFVACWSKPLLHDLGSVVFAILASSVVREGRQVFAGHSRWCRLRG